MPRKLAFPPLHRGLLTMLLSLAACSNDGQADSPASIAPSGDGAAATGKADEAASAASLVPSGSGPWPQCSMTTGSGTGKEPEGVVPVCCAPSDSEKPLVQDLLTQVNSYRASKGKPPLTSDPSLQAAMQGHCLHMATHAFFAHAAPEASVASHTKRAQLCGGRANSEIIASGQADPRSAVVAWSGSPGHNAIMLSNATHVGFCAVQQSGSRIWGGLFR